MRQTMLPLLTGIAIGVLVTLGWVAITGGWYEYEIRPASRCTLQVGATEDLGPSEPVVGFPCVFRTPRFHLP